jgi:MFS transporter, Spinster family, sphingosine-1-phosphate transporter
MISSRMKVYTLVVLTAINLVNYLDRFIISALLPFIKADLHLTDAQLGLLYTSFTVGYLVSSPILGLLGDRMSRKWLAGSCVFVWSLATALSGKAQTYGTLHTIRAVVGVGEAGYGPVAPTIISDSYSEQVRSRMLSIYFIGTPLGSAIGIILGGNWGQHFGWRTAFLVAAIPGFILAVLALFIREPARSPETVRTPSILQTWAYLFKTPSYVYNVLGTTALTFAVGGLAYWFPSFLSRVRGWEVTQATQLFGSTTVIAGITGTMFGGFLADSWHRQNRKAYFLVSAIGMLLAAPTAVASILIESKAWAFPFIFLTVFFLFFNTGPLNAAIISVFPARMRATAMAMNILTIHLLGDAISPVLIGKISDLTHSLTIGMLLGCVTIPVGGLILLAGANRLKQDQENIQSALNRAL